MIPAGVFNQGGESILGFLNINGSYWEDVRPSTRTWPEEYPEAEAMYVTSNNTTSTVTGEFATYLPLKTGVGVSFSLFLNKSGTIRIYNTSSFTNTLRIRRCLLLTTGSWLEIFMGSLPIGTKYKLHFYSGLFSSGVGSVKITVNSEGNPAEVLSKTDVLLNPFVLTPYDPGGEESWLSTGTRTQTTNDATSILLEPLGGSGILNAICVELL